MFRLCNHSTTYFSHNLALFRCHKLVFAIVWKSQLDTRPNVFPEPNSKSVRNPLISWLCSHELKDSKMSSQSHGNRSGFRNMNFNPQFWIVSSRHDIVQYDDASQLYCESPDHFAAVNTTRMFLIGTSNTRRKVHVNNIAMAKCNEQ